MKLYEVYINNGWDYDDEAHETELIVAKDKSEARARAESILLERFGKGGTYNTPFYYIEEIEEVDGFKVVISE